MNHIVPWVIFGDEHPPTASCDFKTVSDELAGTLPPELPALSRLQTLELSGNQLAGTLPARYGTDGAWPLLQELAVADNALSGRCCLHLCSRQLFHAWCCRNSGLCISHEWNFFQFSWFAQCRPCTSSSQKHDSFRFAVPESTLSSAHELMRSMCWQCYCYCTGVCHVLHEHHVFVSRQLARVGG